jgi:hypothetical protein
MLYVMRWRVLSKTFGAFTRCENDGAARTEACMLHLAGLQTKYFRHFVVLDKAMLPKVRPLHRYAE